MASKDPAQSNSGTANLAVQDTQLDLQGAWAANHCGRRPGGIALQPTARRRKGQELYHLYWHRGRS